MGWRLFVTSSMLSCWPVLVFHGWNPKRDTSSILILFNLMGILVAWKHSLPHVQLCYIRWYVEKHVQSLEPQSLDKKDNTVIKTMPGRIETSSSTYMIMKLKYWDQYASDIKNPNSILPHHQSHFTLCKARHETCEQCTKITVLIWHC